MDTQINPEPSNEHVIQASELLKLASDPTRLKILWALLHGEHSVTELAEHVKAQPSAVSQHLAKLRLARLVKVRRDGTKMYYQTDNTHIQVVIEQALQLAEHKRKGH